MTVVRIVRPVCYAVALMQFSAHLEMTQTSSLPGGAGALLPRCDPKQDAGRICPSWRHPPRHRALPRKRFGR